MCLRNSEENPHLMIWLRCDSERCEAFHNKTYKIEMALLITRDDFLYECVKQSTYSIFPSLKYFSFAQTTFTNNRCSNYFLFSFFKIFKKKWSHSCLFLHLTLFLPVSEIVASPGANGNLGLSPQSKENIIQHVTLFTSRTKPCAREKKNICMKKCQRWYICRCIKEINARLSRVKPTLL